MKHFIPSFFLLSVLGLFLIPKAGFSDELWTLASEHMAENCKIPNNSDPICLKVQSACEAYYAKCVTDLADVARDKLTVSGIISRCDEKYDGSPLKNFQELIPMVCKSTEIQGAGGGWTGYRKPGPILYQ